MKFLSNGLIILLLLILTALAGAGCRTFFSERKPAAKIKIAADREINQDWQEITPPAPLEATAKNHVVALKLRAAATAGYADEKEQRIRLADGTETTIEIELIDETGGATALFPNGFGEYVEFGKRAKNKENPDEAFFRIGSKFTKIRLRSEKPVRAAEILWTEFEF